MHDRIKELISEVTSLGYGEDGEDLTPVLVGSGIEKFAELIVRECAGIANAGIDPNESHLIGDDIKEHFGVEQ